MIRNGSVVPGDVRRDIASSVYLQLGKYGLLFSFVSGLIGGYAVPATGIESPREVLLHRFAGETPGAGLGTATHVIPDLDGDGKEDLALGAPFYSPNLESLDVGLVVWVSSATGAELGRATATEDGAQLGWAIAGPGDLDGDDVGDLVVGAPGASFGGAPDRGSVLALSGATGEVLWRVTETGGADRLGTGVVVLEDFDRDGIPEILACGPGTGNRRGRFYLISGADGAVRQKARLGARGEETGASLGLCPDLDGDGLDEILIGAPSADGGKGRVYVISRRRQPLHILRGSVGGARFGAALAGIHDQNGDGVPDLVIGSPGGAFTPGQIHLLSGTDGTEIDSVIGAEGDGFGTSIDTSGDLDGDGKTDLAIGAPHAVNRVGETAGAVLVFSGLDRSPLFRVEGKIPDAQWGRSLATLPDFNSDRRSELVIGSPGATPACRPGAGDVEVLAIHPRETLLYHLAADSFNPLGISVHSAGDVDGDGLMDFLVGVPLEDPDQRRNAGSVLVFSGSDGRLLQRFDGQEEDDEFGTSVTCLGDIDGDGLSDILVGAPAPDADDNRSGTLYAYSVMNAELIYQIEGTQDGDSFGFALSSSQDFDGDGTPDILATSPTAEVEDVEGVGKVELFSGRTGAFFGEIPGFSADSRFGFSADWVASVDGDGIPDLLVGAPYASPGGRLESGLVYLIAGSDWRVLQTMSGENYFDHFGTSVAGLPDYDGDQISEFMVGAPDSNPRGLPDAGSVWVFSGQAGNLLHRIDGPERGDRAGSSVADAGDTNGDGTGDFLVGMSGATGNGLQEAGRILLISGSSGSTLLSYEGDDPGLAVGEAVGGAGDVDGDGFPEIIVGGSGLGLNGNGGRLTVLDPAVPDHLRARVGTVRPGPGVDRNILTVNGQTGRGARRLVNLQRDDPVDIRIRTPGSPGSPPQSIFVAYLWDGEPDDSTVTPLPFGLGLSAFPTPLTGGTPQPHTIVNRTSGSCYGPLTLAGNQADDLVLSIPEGFSEAKTLTVQVMMLDDRATNPEGLTLSNAIVLVVD